MQFRDLFKRCHVFYSANAALLPCDSSHVDFLLQGSASTLLRFGGIGLMADCCIANFVEMYVAANEFRKSASIWWSYVYRICGLLFLVHLVFKVWIYANMNRTNRAREQHLERDELLLSRSRTIAWLPYRPPSTRHMLVPVSRPISDTKLLLVVTQSTFKSTVSLSL